MLSPQTPHRPWCLCMLVCRVLLCRFLLAVFDLLKVELRALGERLMSLAPPPPQRTPRSCC
jgi:hypothetical protein